MMLLESESRFISRMKDLLDSVPAQTDHSYRMALLDSLLAYSSASDSFWVSRRISEVVSDSIDKAKL